MMVKVVLEKLEPELDGVLPFGFKLSFEANSMEAALAEIDKVTKWATPKVVDPAEESPA